MSRLSCQIQPHARHQSLYECASHYSPHRPGRGNNILPTPAARACHCRPASCRSGYQNPNQTYIRLPQMTSSPPTYLAGELAVLCSIMSEEGLVAPAHGWSLDHLADMLDAPASHLIWSVRHTAGIAPQTPASCRIDMLMGWLRESGATPPGGWSSLAIATMAGVSHSSIQSRLHAALRTLRSQLQHP